MCLLSFNVPPLQEVSVHGRWDEKTRHLCCIKGESGYPVAFGISTLGQRWASLVHLVLQQAITSTQAEMRGSLVSIWSMRCPPSCPFRCRRQTSHTAMDVNERREGRCMNKQQPSGKRKTSSGKTRTAPARSRSCLTRDDRAALAQLDHLVDLQRRRVFHPASRRHKNCLPMGQCCIISRTRNLAHSASFALRLCPTWFR